jgi:ribosome-binding protein aMBF1 (putative translation factor)
MRTDKKKRLQSAGWTVGTTSDFLGLSTEEAAWVEMRLRLARSLRETRVARKLTQEELARKISSSQSRVAKMESADPSVSVDLMIRTLLALGKTRKQVGQLIAA